MTTRNEQELEEQQPDETAAVEQPDQQDQTEQDQTEQDQTEQEPTENKAGREAAKYRTRLREVEAELEQARDTIERLTRGRLAEQFDGQNGRPTLDALDKLGISTEGVIGPDGTIDTKQIERISSEARTVLGIGPDRRTYVIDVEGGFPSTATISSGFADAFAPRRR